MDHIERIRTMSIRQLVGWAICFLGIVGLAVLLGFAARLPGFNLGNPSPEFLSALVPAAGTWIVAVGVVWWQLHRLLVARELDRRALPARPELYNFDALNPPLHVDEIGGKALKELTFVVFDTETTGLKPSNGDEIISIAGVKIVDGALQETEAFSRLVNPGRGIPPQSIRFHGITEDMVKDEAPAGEVLQDFHAFCGSAVLVAHNAAFDMKFLKLKEQACGRHFDNLVLDTLLLSVFAEPDSRNHSIDAIAERFGIDVEGRHTALGDSLVTARIFLRLLKMLETRGVTTVRQAIQASVKMEHIQEMDKEF